MTASVTSGPWSESEPSAWRAIQSAPPDFCRAIPKGNKPASKIITRQSTAAYAWSLRRQRNVTKAMPPSNAVATIGSQPSAATPTEAAAIGALLSFVIAACYGKLTGLAIRKSVGSATSLSVMVLFVLTGSAAFSQLLSFSGVTPAITEFATGMAVHPLVVMLMMQLVVMVLGMFIEQTSIVLVTIPIFMPIVAALHWDPIWFGAIMMLNLEMATITPPFGLSLFVMKGIASADTTMNDVYRSVFPFIGLNLAVMALMIAFPQIVLWLPGRMN